MLSACNSDGTENYTPNDPENLQGNSSDPNSQVALVDTLSKQEPEYTNKDFKGSTDAVTETVNGWEVTRLADSQLIVDVTTFNPDKDPVEKLYAAPSSAFDLIQKLYTFNNGVEIRLESTEEYAPLQKEGLSDFKQRSEYCAQYYYGVKVSGGGMYFYAMNTPEGWRVYRASGTLMDVKEMSVVPNISYTTAINIFARHLEMPAKEDWKTQLYINFFPLNKDGKLSYEQRFVYYVGANAVYYPNGNVAYMDEAYVDALTGSLIRVNRWVNEQGYYVSDPTKKANEWAYQ